MLSLTAMDRPWLKPALWVAALAAAAAFVISNRDWVRYQRLERAGIGVDGLVTGKDEQRRVVHYSFEFKDELYGGSDRAGFGSPEFDALEIDAQVVVFFLPQDPGVSSLGHPKEHLKAQNRLIAWTLVLAAIPLVWALRRELRRF